MRTEFSLFMLMLLLVAAGCKNSASMAEATNTEAVQPVYTPGPPAIVYKTRVDYADKVAITLNEDRTLVVAYPHPADLVRENGLPYPTQLAEGYLLDNQGINERVAFTSYTLQEYAALPQAPSQEELMDHILDKEPLQMMCNCGNRTRYRDLVADINKLIAKGLEPCRQLVNN